MKVYISSYRDHWISPYTILQKICFWYVIPRDSDKESFTDDPRIERWANRIEPLCLLYQKIMNRISPQINYVKIDRWDTWSMDHTMSHIIVPMLKQLKATQHGSGNVDLEDVPPELHPKVTPCAANNFDDDTLHERWAWVMDEMIWAFEQKLRDDDESQFHDHSAVDRTASFQQQMQQMTTDWDGLHAHQARKQNGFRLFGKYYQNLWD